ncbi:unnamed protein product [Scytosiphon promiscuus]
MATCKLCGYRGSSTSQPKCPVCDESYELLPRRPEEQDVITPGSQLAQAASRACCGMAQQKLETGAQPPAQSCSHRRRARTTHSNIDLQSLLDLIPAQQNRRKKAEDVLRAVCGGLTSAPADDDLDHGVVYIRPRADPTMAVLKGRYKTHPRVAKSASMSALHRLAHPLIGYDSMEALAPKARRRRQESVERILGRALSDGRTMCGDSQSVRPGRLRKRSYSSTTLPRSSSSGRRLQQTPMAISVNAVNLEGRAAAAPRQRWRGRKNARRHDLRSQTRQEVASPLLRFRASEGRRAKPTLRRKRVATMRSVNGWIRETDPTSRRQHMSLDRQIVALRKKGDRHRRENHNLSDSAGANTQGVHVGGDSATFLTELKTEGSAPAAEINPSQGDTTIYPEMADCQRRGRDERGSPGRKLETNEKKASTMGVAYRGCRRRRSSGKGGAPFSTAHERRRLSDARLANARRDRSEVARFGNKSTKSIQVGNHRNQQLREERYRTPAVAADIRVAERRRDKSPMDYLLLSLGAKDSCLRRTEQASCTVPPTCKIIISSVNANTTRAGLEATKVVSAGHRAVVRRGGSTAAPAWGVSDSLAVSPTAEDSRVGRAWQGSGADTRALGQPCSEWQFLREGGCMSSFRSAELLSSFGNKVASSCLVDKQRRRPTSAVANAEKKPQQQQYDGDGTSSFPSGTRLASMHKRPGSRSWVHRRSLPSLLLSDHKAEGQARSRGRQSTTPPPSRGSSGAAGTLLLRPKRGKRRAALDTPSGRMQRLSKTPPVTVGDAWGGGLSSRAATDRGQRSREVKIVGRETSPDVARFSRGRDSRAPSSSAGHGSVGASAASGKLLLLEAVSEPLLCVGGGGGFQLNRDG